MGFGGRLALAFAGGTAKEFLGLVVSYQSFLTCFIQLSIEVFKYV